MSIIHMKLTSQYGFQDLIDMKIYHKMVKCSYLYGYFFHMRSVWDQNFMCVCVCVKTEVITNVFKWFMCRSKCFSVSLSIRGF